MRHRLLEKLVEKISEFISNGFVGFLQSEPRESSGGWPNFNAARSWARDGEVKKAIALTKAELEKESDNFEGLMLLGSLYADSGSAKLALRTMETLLRSEKLTAEQRQAAEEKKATYERMKR
jgi:hypothetical protein